MCLFSSPIHCNYLSLPSLCLWSPRPSMSLEHLQFPTSHLPDSFASWNSRFMSVLMLKAFPRWAEQLHLSPLLSPCFIQKSQIEQSNLCKCRIWPMAPHVFNGRLRDRQILWSCNLLHLCRKLGWKTIRSLKWLIYEERWSLWYL